MRRSRTSVPAEGKHDDRVREPPPRGAARRCRARAAWAARRGHAAAPAAQAEGGRERAGGRRGCGARRSARVGRAARDRTGAGGEHRARRDRRPTPTPEPRSARHAAAPGTVLSGCGTACHAGADRPPLASGRRPRGRSALVHQRRPLVWAGQALRRYRGARQPPARLSGRAQGGAGGGPYLRFMYGPRDALSPGQQVHDARGEYGVTFIACRNWQQTVPFAGVTDYYGGFLVKGARCVPVQVIEPGRTRSRQRSGSVPALAASASADRGPLDSRA